MLIATNLISEVELALFLISKWNFLPVKYPYKLYVKRFNNIYQFAANPQFIGGNWRWSFLILLFCAGLGTIKIKLELQSTLDAFACFFVTLAAYLVAFTVLFHYRHAKDFVEFLNELINLENRHLDRVPPPPKNWQRHFQKPTEQQTSQYYVASSQLVALTCSFFSVVHILESIMFAASCALFPGAPWNVFLLLVNNFILHPITIIFGGMTDFAAQLWRRSCIFLLYYVSIKIFLNFATINIVINLLASNFCLNSALTAFQR